MKEFTPAPLQPPLPVNRGDAEVFNKRIVEQDEIGLRDYWRVIRRRLWVILACCLGTTLAAALVMMTKAPLYTAETTLLIERQAPQVLNIQGVLSEPLGPDEYDFYKTQYEILKSRTLAARAIQEQGLEMKDLFPGGGREGVVARLWAEAKGWVREQEWVRRLFPPPPKIDTDNETTLGVRAELIDAYMRMLGIRSIKQTRLVKIAFYTSDPALSARLANAHAQAYIRQGLGLRTLANEEAQRFLEEKLEELKSRVEKSEAALNRYRREREIISLDDKENVVVERLADLNKRLTEAEADRITLEAQVRLIRKRDYDTLPAVINNPFIATLKGELARLEGEYAQLSAQFRPGYPRLDQLKVQMKEARRRLREEIQRAIAGVESSYLMASTTEKALRDKMEEQKATALGLKDASVEYAILAREVDTNRQLYDSVLQRMKETGVAAELRASNISIIDKAAPPRTRSNPMRMKSLLLSALVGLMGGVCLAFLFEYLDNTLRTPEEVERYLRLPNLGVVPDFTSLNGRRYLPRKPPYILSHMLGPRASGEEVGLVLAEHPFSMVMEAYRTLRAAIFLSRAGQPPKTLLFTSAIRGEGKTVTMLSTAFAFAQMSVRVLVIDADLRRPDCHRVLEMEQGPGLTEVLTGQRGPMEVIRPTAINGLFLLSAGALPPNPAELVGSKTMQETVAFLGEHYDYVLIDSPPLIQVSDAALLSTMVDGVVPVIRSQGTPTYVVREALSRLSYAQAKVLGVVLNRVNLRSGDYAYYYRSPYS